MGEISWVFAVISLRSVQPSCPISAPLAEASKVRYLEEDSVAPGNWDLEAGYQWQLLRATETLQREGENVLPSSFIKSCKTNWNKKLPLRMMWVKSTCHRRHELSEIWKDCSQGRERGDRSRRGISKGREGKAYVKWWETSGAETSRCVKGDGGDRTRS